jgi:hypothetical protein
VLVRQREPRALLAKLLVAHPQLASFDPLDAICDGQRCAIKIEDMLLYRDSHHLSFRGSQRVARAFLAWLGKGT